ncbi:MAG: hypothetical protein Q4C61_11580 [Lachnospiraceae bacterium]|nr:hypothetical protein [Lachnospiraceae bacterium]
MNYELPKKYWEERDPKGKQVEKERLSAIPLWNMITLTGHYQRKNIICGSTLRSEAACFTNDCKKDTITVLSITNKLSGGGR